MTRPNVSLRWVLIVVAGFAAIFLAVAYLLSDTPDPDLLAYGIVAAGCGLVISAV